MDDKNERTQQEYAYIMDGITTRMQLAIKKISDTSRMVCITMILVVLIVMAGFIFNNKMMIDHVNNLRSSMTSEAVVTHEAVSEQRPGTGD